MKCNQCGQEMRIAPEQVGVDGNGIPVFHRHAYCDNCRLKWDLDYQEQQQNLNGASQRGGYYSNSIVKEKKKARPILVKILGAIVAIIGFSSLLNSLSGNSASPKTDIANKKNSVKPKESSEIKSSKLENLNVNKEVIFEDGGIKVSTSGISHSGNMTELKLVAENETKDDWSIVAHSYAVNDLMCGTNEFGFGTIDVPSGKKGSFSIEIEDEWLEQYGFDDISSFKMTFWGYKDDFAELQTGSFTVKTNHYDKSVTVSPIGEDVYSDDDIDVWYIDSHGDNFKFLIYCKNNIGSYTVEGCSINEWGYDVTDYTYDLYDEPIIKKTYAMFELPVDSKFIEKNKIEKIEEIEFNVKYDYDYKNENSGKIKTTIK